MCDDNVIYLGQDNSLLLFYEYYAVNERVTYFESCLQWLVQH